MKVIIQVCDEASVTVNNEIISKINKGYLLLVGIEKEDNEMILEKMATKIINMRINKDNNDKTNLSILDVGGEILSVSQFTLAASLDSRRPSFTNAKEPIEAKRLYLYFDECLRNNNVTVKEGIFQEEMIVNIINHGPFTIIVDSKDFFK